MNRRPLIAGNWKMNKLLSEAEDLVCDLKVKLSGPPAAETVLIPPFTALRTVSELIANTGIFLGAQNLSHEGNGAFTGEISASMLRDVGCTYVLVGHSERRSLYGEKSERLHTKLKIALSFGLTPIFCLGETLEERAAFKTAEVIEHQLENGLVGLSESQIEQVIVAYEPVWAIGTGKNATPEQGQEIHRMIRKFIRETWKKPLAEKTRILYGGSVKSENARDLLAEEDIDGLLVGGASLNAESFYDIMETVN